MMKPFLICTLAATLTVVASGCGRNDVKVYRVESSDSATPTPPPAAASAAMPATMPAGLSAPDNSGMPPLKYTVPSGWKEKELSQMRVASFGISDAGKNADISVIPLGGLAGGDLANVNRWRGQVGLQPLPDAELQALAEKIVVAGQPADLYDVAGNTSGVAQRIIGVILHRNDTAWFFKMAGDSDLVEKNKPAFVDFLKSVEFGGLPAPSTMDLSQLPASHPAIPGMTPVAPASSEDGSKPAWTIPASWQAGPLAQFLVAKFVVTGTGDARAEVNVSSLDGDGGGLAPNVNHWRGPLGLPPVTEISATTMDVPGGKASVVDFSGTNARTGKAARLIGVIVPLGGQTWFYKLMGDETIVTTQKEAFTRFIQSAKYPDAH
jgi:hypothetical protein